MDPILEKFNLNNEENKEEIVYGVYDNRKTNIFTRINDFLIDHSKISIKDKSYFFHLLAVMVDSGLPLVRSLKVLVDRTENIHLKRVINTIQYNMENKGQTLAQSMQKFPDVFDESEIGIVKSGEETGKLDQMLFKLAKQLERSYELKLKIKGAMVYPLTVVIALILAGIIVMIFVIPKLKSFFTENSIDLPLPTQILINTSNFMGSYWWAVLLVIIAFSLITNFYINTEHGKFKWHYYLLKTPLIGPLIVKLSIVKFVRFLEVLIASGLPITKVLKICADSIGNTVYQKKLYSTAEHVQQGEKISDNLENATLIFPKTLVEMLRVGENSAAIDTASAKMADHFEREIEHDLKNIITILEPSMIVLIGFIVVFMAFAIMAPIFNLSSIS
ncbi:hypothetical protein A2335_01600 [Candidatus Peregrinibacteria bacterium RIFOXYB2_FULL_32_7]|nr:MAG: hypothetical protein A2335_01600 [Candidatus Peregrinibacteria bacterium RIFOXYB2_FULL_32_7]